MPKPVWALIILFIPVIGFILWYAFGRGSEDKPSAAPRRAGPSAPDDDDDYLRKVDRDVKLGKHAPEPQKPEDKTPEADDADEAADSDTHSADTDEHGSGGSSGDGRGHSN